MPVSLIPSFLSFCFINGITPGPANLCSLSTAMNEGKQAALRQWRGLFTGFAIVSLGSAMVNAFLGSVLGDIASADAMKKNMQASGQACLINRKRKKTCDAFSRSFYMRFVRFAYTPQG